ncbi:MAG: hypothetical protein J7501_18525, partial [Bdellovibrio sp.]|nr:hypothetical protein [Bdellovibrio sp.]
MIASVRKVLHAYFESLFAASMKISGNSYEVLKIYCAGCCTLFVIKFLLRGVFEVLISRTFSENALIT